MREWPLNKMRILFVGYGFYPSSLGGVGAIQWELLNTCRELGFHLAIYQGGMYNFRKKVKLRRKVADEGVDLIDLVNSPNRSGLRNPISQVMNTHIVNLSREVLQAIKPDLVHIHELTFHCAKIIELCADMQIPCVKTIHNYWDICPQRDLLYNCQEICEDFLNGSRCVSCRHSWVLYPWVAIGFDLLRNNPLFPMARQLWHGVQSIGRRVATDKVLRSIPDSETIERLAREYSYRRKQFISLLNKLTLVHIYSRRSGEILQQYGVRADKLRCFRMTTHTIDAIKPKNEHSGQVPIVFGYRGGLAPHKGVHILVEAFKRLDQNKAKLVIFGTGSSSYVSDLKKIAKGTNAEFRGSYEPAQINRVNAVIDVGIIPSIWEELFGLVGIEYIQSRIPIVASEIGGVVEYVQHGENGFLVRPNDVDALFSAMHLFIEAPNLIRTMQSQMKRWISVHDMKEHLASFYKEALRTEYKHV
jgi:glycosyltransferase involved in cell wall biosynthesis